MNSSEVIGASMANNAPSGSQVKSVSYKYYVIFIYTGCQPWVQRGGNTS